MFLVTILVEASVEGLKGAYLEDETTLRRLENLETGTASAGVALLID